MLQSMLHQQLDVQLARCVDQDITATVLPQGAFLLALLTQ